LINVEGGVSKVKQAATYGQHYGSFHDVPPIVHYAILLLVIASVVLSTLAYVKVRAIEQSVVPQTIDIDDFLRKLTSHEETKALVGVAPLNIVQITQNNLGNLQSQISGLDTSYVGSYLVQYSDRIVVYDYANDQLKGAVALQQPPVEQLAQDFVSKLYAHPEVQGLQNEQPLGGQLDAESLATLKQQFPDVYANAKVGDFLLRYSTKLIIYDYQNDRVVNAVNLG
jgi:hypothetical protein